MVMMQFGYYNVCLPVSSTSDVGWHAQASFDDSPAPLPSAAPAVAS